jgi:hypothetical protein
MRPRCWVILAICCLVVAGLRIRHSCGISAAAQPKKPATPVTVKPTNSSPQTVLATKDFETRILKPQGIQEKRDKEEEAAKAAAVARGVVLEDAFQWVGDFLSRQDPPIEWRPDTGYIEKNLGKFSEPVPEEKPELIELGAKETIVLHVEITQKTLDDMRAHDREYHNLKRKEISGARQVLLARILAGVVAGLVALGAYLRLDEATKGYYKTWLRLGSLALVATVGAGVWLLW